MPVRVGSLTRDRRTVAVVVGDESLRVTYRPGGFTPETEDRIHEGVAAQRYAASLVALLEACLVEWDLVDEAGVALPVTPAVLRTLPGVFLAQVAKAIQDDLRPNPSSAGGSGAG